VSIPAKRRGSKLKFPVGTGTIQRRVLLAAQDYPRRTACCAINRQPPSSRLDLIPNLFYIGAATFLSIKEVIPEVHFELRFKLEGRPRGFRAPFFLSAAIIFAHA